MTWSEEFVAFLRAIDPEQLEKEALARLDVWGETSPTQAILDVLIEWISQL